MQVTREQRKAWTATTRDSAFNRWLRSRVNGPSGTLDLVCLASVAAEFGIDASVYAHLNPGQQRMTIGNRLRKIVPSSAYAEIGQTTSALPSPEAAPAASGPLTGEASGLPPGATDRDLMRLYATVIEELRARGIVRTGNAPLGDYAEWLFAKAFGWRLENNSAAGHDATDGGGLRFQIKARRLRTGTPGERQLSVIRALPGARFDMLAAVLLDKDFAVLRAALLPHDVVVKHASYIKHVNGWRLMLEDAVWDEPDVGDVTAALTAAQ